MKNNTVLRIALPYTDDNELKEIHKVLLTGYLTQGPKVVEFEKLIADYIGSKYAFATTSATTALHLALSALGIKPGDEVLVPDFTFPATANVVVQLGAIPILVDIDLTTFNMNTTDLIRKITSRSKAIMPVHAFGLSADMNPIKKIANQYRLAIIEDAACALGTTYYGKKCGTLGDMGCFSFHPRKAITTGEGGMITTNNSKLANKIQLLRSHGGVRKNGRFKFFAAGYNYRLSDILAAVGVAQMKKLDVILEKRKQLAAYMTSLLIDIKEVTLPTIPIWQGHVFQSYVLLLDKEIDRDQVIQYMKNNNIETTLGTYALHDQPFFRKTYNVQCKNFPNSHLAYKHSLTIPLYAQMVNKEVEYIANTLKLAIKAAKK